MSDHDFGQDLGQWPTQLTSRTDHLTSCAWCIDGFLPVFDAICGPGFMRCSSNAHLNIACPVCGFSTFYPLDLRTDGATWSAYLTKVHRLWAVLCTECSGVVTLTPVQEDWDIYELEDGE